MNNIFRAPQIIIKLAESGVENQIQIFKTGTFFHPQYGKFVITPEILKNMEQNFKANVRGIDLAVDYKHDNTNIAAGWIKSVSLSEDGNALYADVEWTPNGKRVLNEKEFRYVSPEFTANYTDNETLKKFGPTLLGAGLTNRPVIKGMDAVVELSEYQAADAAPPVKEVPPAAKKPTPKKGMKPMQDFDVSPYTPDAIAKMSTEDMQALIAKMVKAIADDQAADAAAGEADAPAMADVKKKLADMTAKCAAMEDSKKLAEKKSAFAKLLTEGKAVAAQEQAYLSGDVVKFSELASHVNLSENGHGAPGTIPAAKKDEQDEVMALAEAKIKADPKMALADAISFVLAEKPELASKIYV